MIEVSTILKFEDKEDNKKKSYFELVYVSIVKLDESVKEKKEIQKIILCDVQKDIQPKIEKTFTFSSITKVRYNNVKVRKLKMINE